MFTAMAVSATAFSQSIVQQEITSSVAKEIVFPTPSVNAADPTDTLGFDELGQQLISYSSPSGFVFGTNELVDPQFGSQYNLEYARGFIVNDPYVVIGAGAIFGGKNDVSGSPAAIKVRLYGLDADRALGSATSQAPDAIGPAASIETSADLLFDDVDTLFPAITWVDFNSEAWMPTDFAIGFNIGDLYNGATNPADSVFLLADADGDSDGDYTFTRIGIAPSSSQSQSLWALSGALLQGGLANNLAIFAVVAESPNSIEEQGFLNGVKMTTYPNPALSGESITVQYGLQDAAEKVEINVFDMNGRLVHSIAEGDRTAGIHSIEIPAGTLTAGSYLYVMQANNGRMAKRLEVLK